MKRILVFSLLAVILLSCLAPAARAEETEPTETTEATEAAEVTEETEPQKKATEGWLENNFYWELKDGTLTITGQGSMPGQTPWREYSGDVRKVIFSEGVLSVSGAAFRDFANLKEVVFCSTMREIGEQAFRNCTSIKEIRLPNGFKRFGISCFEGCIALTQVYCDGYMPNFRTNCLWNGSIMYIYYHPDRPWKVEDIRELEQGFGGRLEVLSQDGTDPIPNDETAPEPPAPVAAETVPAVTEAPTVPATVPPTEPPVETMPLPTIPETVAPEPTVPETTMEPVEEQTEAPTEESAEPLIQEETIRGGFIGLALILGVLTFFIVGALIFKVRSRNGRY